MKKQLLSTSALVAAGLFGAAGAASAQTAPASSPIQVTVGGYMYQFLSYTSQDDRTGGAAGSTNANFATTTAKPLKVQVNNDSEIWFQGKSTLANGISVAMRVELEGNTETDQIDESFAIVEGAFGRIEVGSTDNAAYKTSIHAPDAAMGIGTAGVMGYVSNLVANPTSSGILDTPFETTLPRMADNDSEKISYFSPRFEGFQLGLSYIPELTQDRGGIGGVRYKSNTYNTGFAAGLNFTRAFGPIDIAAAAGYTHFNKPDSTTTSNATLSDPKGYNFGLQVGYAGFRVGGSYLKVKDYAFVTPAASAAGSTFTGAGWTAATGQLGDGRSFDAGLTYTFGPAVVGVTYFDGRSRGDTATAGHNKLQGGALTGRYQLGPGVNVEASVFHVKIDSKHTSDIEDNKATGLMTGLLLNF